MKTDKVQIAGILADNNKFTFTAERSKIVVKPNVGRDLVHFGFDSDGNLTHLEVIRKEP
jgi:hypothetical protein